MSKMIPFSANAVPDYIREEGQSELTKSLMSRMGGTSKRISIRGKVFRLVVGGEEIAKRQESLDVIVVHVAKDVSRTYYEGAYDPKAEAKPPTCWSADSKTPHPSVENPVHSNCNECPMNIKGSGSGNNRACRFKRRIAVVLADDLNAGVHMLELPATSLFGKGDVAHMPYEQYFKYVSTQGHSIDRLITRMSFDEDSDQPKLFFAPIGFPPKEWISKLVEYSASPEAKMAVTLTVYQSDQKALPNLKEAIEQTAKASKKPVAVEADGPDDEEEESLPVVKAAKPKEQPTAKRNVLSVMEEFANRKRKDVDDDE